VPDKIVNEWTLYILKCIDGTLYTGITNNLQKRYRCHITGKASRYTRARLPVYVVYTENCSDRSSALKREYAVKHLSRTEKNELIFNMDTFKKM
jgi:putative endonuclease